MLRQYRALKREHAASILLFRMGDFYEMFFDDAREASRLLDLTLTARGRGTDNVVPMCGFPYHQLDQYTARLVRAQRKVAICEQVEDPRLAKGLVRREVVRVVTPGTVLDQEALESKANNWLAAVARAGTRLGAAFLDVSTGELQAWETAPGDPASPAALDERLRAFAPSEIVVPEGWTFSPESREAHAAGAALTAYDPARFAPDQARAALERRFGVLSLDGFGLRDRPAAVAAAGGLLAYAEETQRSGLQHVDRIQHHEPGRFLRLDPATRRNLELERGLRDGSPRGSLVAQLDATATAGGGRMLRAWLLAPLLDPAEIEARQDAVEELSREVLRRAVLRETLGGIQDLERLLARVVAGSASPRDLCGLRASLERAARLLEPLGACAATRLAAAARECDPCSDVAARVAAAIADEPPAALADGGVIRTGFDPELDRLRAIQRDGRGYVASLEARERQATGIASLKVRYNRVFGYYIEVSRPNLPAVPARYQRKQTIATGERFVTPELKEQEATILEAEERAQSLELALFQRLREELAGHAARIKALARVVAEVDVLAGLAEQAARHGYCRPRVGTHGRLRIVRGRHPVVERTLADRRFVPNDTWLECGAEAIAVLTGPNMGGKSTYLRQVALITLLAQAGSFVPAAEAEVGIVDRIFCRVGAADSLAEGQSTFMVEMTETANILHHATPRSLLLLDEVGRGTSTFDGLSIAWAVVEHLAALPGGAPRCLFATHYHELTELAGEMAGVINLRMAVREDGGDVAFLHRVEAGAQDRSYGLHVARLAGVPHAVVERAGEILANIERDEYGRDGHPRRARSARRPAPPPAQATLFSAADPPGPETAIAAELAAIEPDQLRALDALNLVAGWVERLRAARKRT